MAITLLGTSHISPESASRVREEILSGSYDLVAIELDRYRLQHLFDKNSKNASLWQLVKAVGVSGALFAKLGQYVQRKLGGRIGMQPGEEMRAAVRSAAEAKLQVALIDRPLHQTLRRFSDAFTFREKLRLVKNAFSFGRVQIDLRAVPDDAMIQQLLEELKHISPALYKVLVAERNQYMVAMLRRIQKHHPDAHILAVVGAGHVPGMKELLGDAAGRQNA